jgi:hypothetical protein
MTARMADEMALDLTTPQDAIIDDDSNVRRKPDPATLARWAGWLDAEPPEWRALYEELDRS